MHSENLKKATVSSIVWKLLERGGRSLVELVVQIVLARLLAPDDFGALAVMLVFVNIGNVIVQSGLNTALVQFPDIDQDDCSTVFWLCFCMSLVLYAIVFLVAPAVASFYVMPHIVWPLRALALILLIGAFNSVQVAIVQRELQFRKVFNATLVAVLASGIAGVGVALAGGGLWALVVQQLVYQVTSCAVLGVNVKWHPHLVFNPARALALFGFGWKLLVSGLLDQGYQSLSDLIIGKQFSSSSLGLVSQGKKYPQAIGSMLDGAIQPVMLSAVAHVQFDVAQVKRLVRRALKTSTFLIVPAMTLFAVVAEPVVRILLGEQWVPCAPFLQMYCFVYALLPIHTANLQALNGMGRSDLFLKLEVVKKSYGVVFLLVAAFVFRDVYVMVGTYMLTGVIATFVNSYPNKRVIDYSYCEQLRDIIPAFVLSAASGAAALVVGALIAAPAAKIAVEAVVMLSAYLGLSALLHLEAFTYLVATAKGFLGSRNGSKA